MSTLERVRRCKVAVALAVLVALAGCTGAPPADPGNPDPGTPPPSSNPGPGSPPAAPRNLRATPGSGLVDIAWTSVQGASGYRVYWGTAPEQLEQVREVPAHTPYTRLGGLTPGTTWYISVDAAAGELRSERAPLVSATPLDPDATGFVVVSHSPDGGTAPVRRDEPLFFAFSEPLADGGLKLDVVPATALEPPRIAAGGRWASVRPATVWAASTRYTVTLEATSTQGDSLPEPLRFGFTTGTTPTPYDEVPPRVVEVFPAPDASNVSPRTDVWLRFNRDMDRASVEAAFQMTPDAGCHFEWSPASDVLTCQPGSPLRGDTLYEVRLEASARAADGGLALEAPFVSRFHTHVPDTTPPTLVAFSPQEGAKGVSPSTPIVLDFSESVDCSSVTQSFRLLGPEGRTQGTVDCGSKQFKFHPQQLLYGEAVSWELAAGVRDGAGNVSSTITRHGYQTARLGSKRLTALAPPGGWVGQKGQVQQGGTSLPVGVRPADGEVRGFITFDLGQLPPEALRISGARIAVFQQQPVEGEPFTRLGAVVAQSTPYGPTLDAADFAATSDSYTYCEWIFICYPRTYQYTLSSSDTLGARTAEVGGKVSIDFNKRNERGNRSQFRLQMSKPEGTDGGVDVVHFRPAGDPLTPPSLEVKYEYP